MEYLGKEIVNSLDEIPSGNDPSKYILKKKDMELRMKAVNENLDICNAVFQKRMKLMWEEILQPLFGGMNYIKRYEFQLRGKFVRSYLIFTPLII